MGLNKKKICLIGAGKTMTKHLEVLKKFKHFKIVGIFNRSKNNAIKLKKKFKIKKIFNSIESMFNETKAEYLIVVVSSDANFKIMKSCIRFPWKILTEKPLGLTFSESNKLIKLINKNKSKVHIALNRRHYASTKFMLRELNKNQGEKRFLEIFDQQAPTTTQFSKKEIKNWQYANSIHLIDYINLICRGKIIKLSKEVIKIQKKQKIISCEIKFSSGDICYYKSFWYLPGPWSVKVTTNTKVLESKPLEKVTLRNLIGKPSKKFINYKNDLEYKPGFFKQMEGLLNEKFRKKLVNQNDYKRLIDLTNKIYR